MKFDSENFKLFRKDVEDLLKPLEDKYGIKLSAGAICYNNLDFTLTLSAEKKQVNAGKVNFVVNCKDFGFEPSDYNRKVIISNNEYLFVGFNPDNKEQPCNIINITDNKMYQCSVMSIEYGLETEEDEEEGNTDNGVSIFDMYD